MANSRKPKVRRYQRPTISSGSTVSPSRRQSSPSVRRSARRPQGKKQTLRMTVREVRNDLTEARSVAEEARASARTAEAALAEQTKAYKAALEEQTRVHAAALKQQQEQLEKIQTQITINRTVNEKDNMATTPLRRRAGLTSEEIAEREERNRRQSDGSSRAIKMEFKRTRSGDLVNTLTTPHDREKQIGEIKTGDKRDAFFDNEYNEEVKRRKALQKFKSGVKAVIASNKEVAGINKREIDLNNLQERMTEPLSSARRNVGSNRTLTQAAATRSPWTPPPPATTPPPATPPPPATTPNQYAKNQSKRKRRNEHGGSKGRKKLKRRTKRRR